MYEDLSFEDFNLIEALTDEHFPLNWFLWPKCQRGIHLFGILIC